MSGIINTPSMSFAWAKNIQEMVNGFNSMNPILEHHQQTFKVPNQKGTYNFKINGRGYLLNAALYSASTFSVIYYIKMDGALKHTFQILEDSLGSCYEIFPFCGGTSRLSYERWTNKLELNFISTSLYFPLSSEHMHFTHNAVRNNAYFPSFENLSFENNMEISIYVDATNSEESIIVDYMLYK